MKLTVPVQAVQQMPIISPAMPVLRSEDQQSILGGSDSSCSLEPDNDDSSESIEAARKVKIRATAGSQVATDLRLLVPSVSMPTPHL